MAEDSPVVVPVGEELEEVFSDNDDTEKPYYFDADYISRSKRYDIDDFNSRKRPSIRNVLRTVLQERELSDEVDENGEPMPYENLYEAGMWVEYRGNDMKWKLGQVNRIVRQAPDDWDYDEEDGEPPEHKMNYYYNVGAEGLVYKEDVRAPEEALQVVFGKRPWVWQQFTLLQLEKRLRFDKDHEWDFDEIDNLRFGRKRWDAFLEAPENSDFKKHYDAQPEIAKDLLQNHMLTPFELIDIVTEDFENWDYDDTDISIYTYFGVLGSGGQIAIATFFIQIVTPFLLLYNNLFQSDGEPTTRFFVTEDGGGGPKGNMWLPSTDWATFCNGEGRLEGKILIIAVILIYIFSVVPDSLLTFFRVSGGSESTYSKINSLRLIVWEQHDDTLNQQLGFKVDRYMNTGYICLLYAIMLFILLNTPNILDLILNALAIEYIHRIDEELADADWFDPGNRWIRAGTCELILQGTLRLKMMEDYTRFCKFYDIKVEDWKRALGGSFNLYAPKIAARDKEDTKYMTRKERAFKIAADQAKEVKNPVAIQEFEKSIVQFGIYGAFLQFLGLRKSGVFNRYYGYRSWSRWEKIMFLPAVPEHINLDEYDGVVKGKKQRVKVAATTAGNLAEFLKHVSRVLLGLELVESIKTTIEYGQYGYIIPRIFFGVIEIILYALQIVFPFFIVMCLVILPICY